MHFWVLVILWKMGGQWLPKILETLIYQDRCPLYITEVMSSNLYNWHLNTTIILMKITNE
jgi:hypothetical protein